MPYKTLPEGVRVYGFLVDAQLFDRMGKEAARLRVTKADLVRMALIEYMDGD